MPKSPRMNGDFSTFCNTSNSYLMNDETNKPPTITPPLQTISRFIHPTQLAQPQPLPPPYIPLTQLSPHARPPPAPVASSLPSSPVSLHLPFHVLCRVCRRCGVCRWRGREVEDGAREAEREVDLCGAAVSFHLSRSIFHSDSTACSTPPTLSPVLPRVLPLVPPLASPPVKQEERDRVNTMKTKP